jgi:hypothetical protein
MRFTLAALALAWTTSLLAGAGQRPLAPSAMREHPAIGYSSTPPTDLVAQLGRRLESGETVLHSRPGSGYLESVLAALGVPVESQLLVFSKTSFQAPRINPKNPRAIYFNDSVSVGWVPGGEVIEFIGHDPRQGAMFYTLDQTEAEPRVSRNLACVQCHTFADTLDVPGMVIGSVFPGSNGSPLYAPSNATDHRTPFELRWGGWYVTGRHHFDRHMGNTVYEQGPDPERAITAASAHVDSLAGRFDTTIYPSAGSDVAALMVLEHQARMLNLITRAGWEARLGAAAARPLAEPVEELVDYLLFVDEAPLPGPVTSGAFAATFSAGGPRDRNGRSLRQLDLQRRLMRYPCSYLIYSDAFNSLPANARDAVYRRLWLVLSGADRQPRYDALTTADREAVLAILRDTKRDLPPYFFD